MKCTSHIGFLIIALCVSGCTYGNRASYDQVKRAPTNPTNIEVFESASLTRPHKVIGVVTSDSYYMHSALKSCRKEAAEMGADALLDFGPNGNQTGMATMMGGYSAIGASYNTGFTAKAIVWK